MGHVSHSPSAATAQPAREANARSRQYHPPAPYANTTLAVFQTSSANATHWTANFVCSDGCSSWFGGSIDPNNNNATFGWGASSRPIESPSSPTSPIHFHDVAMGHFDMDLTKAKRTNFDALVKAASTTALV